jgi:bifunctional DNA-binding transcriptional regulator/antitoxin component of YhaV-PrlF toxin-antitoxin module
MSETHTLIVQYHPDLGHFIELPEELAAQAKLKPGDDVEWIDQGDGSWYLKKVEKKVWVMVEAIQSFRMRYMVEAPADHPEYALDTVTMNEAKEFSQEALPEVITSHRVMTKEEAIELCDIDNDYTKSWTTESKMKAFFTKEGEKEVL